MAYSITFGSSVSGSGVVSQSKSVTVTGDGLDNRQITVPVGADQLVELLMTLTRIKGYYIVSDKDVRLETNSSVGTGTAGETINLEANEPIMWYDGCQYSKHFSSNITSLYITNGGSAEATVQIIVVKDVTP